MVNNFCHAREKKFAVCVDLPDMVIQNQSIRLGLRLGLDLGLGLGLGSGLGFINEKCLLNLQTHGDEHPKKLIVCIKNYSKNYRIKRG